MQIKVDESAYSSKFRDILYSWDRYIIAYGGRGSGKTDTLLLKYILSLFEPYYFKLAYVNQEQSNIRDQQYAGFKRVAKRIGVFDKLRFYDGDYRIVNTANDNMLVPKGMDDPEKTKGLDDITAVWWDEINKGTKDGFSALDELLRTPQGEYLQFAISFNPVSKEHWLRHTFFHPENYHQLHPNYQNNTLLNHSTYKDNEFIDQEAYRQTLLSAAAGNKNKLRVNIEGEWGVPENNNPWLYNFDADKHVREVPFIQSYPVYLSFDFNREPVSCLAFQMSPNKGQPTSFIHCIREFAENVQLHELCERIKATYPQSIMFVTGDASGNAGNVGFEERHATYYKMIQKYLGLSPKQMNINKKNLEHNDSRNLCNMMLYHYAKIHVSPKCKMLLNDIDIATVDDKKQKAGVLLKDRKENKMDVFDCWRYFYQTYFLEFVEKAYLSQHKN